MSPRENIRLDWIDVFKGLGILCVVVGHVVFPLSRYIYWFHMPLFFCVSGYLYRPGAGWRGFVGKRVRRLIVPYLCYLALIGLPCYAVPGIGAHAGRELALRDFGKAFVQLTYGGRLLDSWCGVFWFVTALFFCQLLYHLLYTHWGLRGWRLAIGVGVLYGLAVLDGTYLQHVPLPWSINAVPLMVVFYWAGHLASRHPAAQRMTVALAAVGLATAISLDAAGVVRFTLDIKSGDYGVPVLSVLLAWSCLALLAQCARLITRLALLRGVFTSLGRASLVIMFLHQPIQMIMRDYAPLSSTTLRVVVALLLPYALFRLWERFPLCRTLLLGECSRPSVGTRDAGHRSIPAQLSAAASPLRPVPGRCAPTRSAAHE